MELGLLSKFFGLPLRLGRVQAKSRRNAYPQASPELRKAFRRALDRLTALAPARLALPPSFASLTATQAPLSVALL